MMGLGPKGCSLLQRVGAHPPVWTDPFAMQLEAQARGEARREKAIWYAQRHSKPKKPEAPVKPMPKEKGKERVWYWIGEAIPSKGIFTGDLLIGSALREAGFKLPKIEGKTK